jgi:uncharacterized membrane protein
MELSLERDLKSALDINAASRPTLAENSPIHQGNLLILGAALVAFFVKLVIAYNTFGTNDVASFYMFSGSLREHGLEWTYRNGVIFFSNFPVFNHPPLTANYLQFIDYLSRNAFLQERGVTFPLLLRLPGIVADLIAVLILIRIRDMTPQRRIPTWAMLLFALSPVSIMVSGFHGNTDPVMAMFLVLTAYMCLLKRPVLSGIFFALSCQIKIIPLLLLPILSFFWLNRRAAIRFTIPLLLLTTAMWIQPLVKFPMLFFRNVFLYNSYWGSWGISYWLKLTQWSQFNGGFFHLQTAATIVAWALKLGIVCAVLIIAWRRRHLSERALVDSFAYGWMVFFVFAPGVCPQYMVWLAPFILLFSPTMYGWFTLSSALALFFFYNGLTAGLPWYIGIARNNAGGLSQSAPWALWPWAALIAGLFYFWRRATETDPTLRLFSVEALPAERSD